MQFVSDNNLHIALVAADNDLVQKVFRRESLALHRGRGHDMLDNRLVAGACDDARGKDFQIILSGIASDLYDVLHDTKCTEASYDLAVALQSACQMHLSEFDKIHALPRAILVDIRDRSNPEVRIGLA